MNVFTGSGTKYEGSLVGVRPHDIALTAPGEGDGVGRVELVEPLGSTTIVHLRVEDVAVRPLRVVVAPDTAVGLDERVGFRINHARVHLFHERTGRRLN